MTIAELKTQIVSKRLKSVYIFTGTEIAVRDIYIKQISKIGGYDVKWMDDVSDVIKAGRKKTMLQKPILYILSECAELVKTEKAWKVFDMDFGTNMLICMFTSLDKRVKFYKQYKDITVEFESLKPEILKKYIRKEISLLSDKNCEKLMEICEYDYGRCLLEIDKINRYQAYTWKLRTERERDGGIFWTNECFLTLLKNGIIHQPPKDVIFDFVDAIMRRNPSDAFRLMQESYDCGEATLVMLANLYSNFKALLQVQSCKSRDISNCTGLTGWQISNAIRYKGNYSTGELVDVLLRIRGAEVGIKSGTIDEAIAISYLLVNIL